MPREKEGYRYGIEYASVCGAVRRISGEQIMEIEKIKDPKTLKKRYGLTPKKTMLESEYIRMSCR